MDFREPRMMFVVLNFVIMVFTHPTSYNVVVTRRKYNADKFTELNATSDKCAQSSAYYNSSETCQCYRGSETFIVQWDECVNGTSFLDRMNLSDFAVIQSGNPQLIHCDRAKDFTTLAANGETQSHDSISCKATSGLSSGTSCTTEAASYLHETTGKWMTGNLSRDEFKIMINSNTQALKLKAATDNPQFLGAVVKIGIECTNGAHSQKGHIIFKVAGRKTWAFPPPTSAMTSQKVSTESSSEGMPTSLVSTRTTLPSSPTEPVTVSGGTSARKRREGENGGNTLTTIVPAVLGSIALIILALALLWFFIRKRRKHGSETNNVENSENPTYGRGSDVVMTTGHKNDANTADDEGTNYQPIVQNTRASGVQPTYQALGRKNQRQPAAQSPSIDQSLTPNSPSKPAEEQGNYQSLVKNRNSYNIPGSDHQQNAERDYAVLKGPGGSADEAEAPVYQVLEQEHHEEPSQDDHSEPVYNVLEAE